MKKRNRLFAILLSAIMAISCMPAFVFAGAEGAVPANVSTEAKPEKMTWTYKGEAETPRGVIGKHYIFGNDFYYDGNELTITFDDDSIQTYICREVPTEDGGVYVGYFLNGNPTEEELHGLREIIENESGLYAEGENYFRIVAYVNETEVSTEPILAIGYNDPYEPGGDSSYTPSVVPAAAPVEIIDLPTVKISKPAAAKKKITVKWKKVSKKNLKKISGIQIQVATDPDFVNIVKTATAGKKKTSKVIKGLQSKTKYYVRIRAYAAGDHYSAWKSKSAKVK